MVVYNLKLHYSCQYTLWLKGLPVTKGYQKDGHEVLYLEVREEERFQFVAGLCEGLARSTRGIEGPTWDG